MKLKKLFSLACATASFLFSSFYCKADDPYDFKVCIMGDTGSGKTTICDVMKNGVSESLPKFHPTDDNRYFTFSDQDNSFCIVDNDYASCEDLVHYYYSMNLSDSSLQIIVLPSYNVSIETLKFYSGLINKNIYQVKNKNVIVVINQFPYNDDKDCSDIWDDICESTRNEVVICDPKTGKGIEELRKMILEHVIAEREARSHEEIELPRRNTLSNLVGTVRDRVVSLFTSIVMPL